LEVLIKNKFEFLWQKQISPSEFDKMAYWEFEFYIDLMNDRNKEESKQHKEQQQKQEEQKSSMMPKIPDYNNIMNNMKIPKI